MSLSARPALEFFRAVMVGAVVPVLLTIINQRLVGELILPASTTVIFFVCATLVIEIGVCGVLIARFIEATGARWVAYNWMWVLIDVVVIPQASQGSSLVWLAVAILCAQHGLVVVWAVFGSVRWAIRWPLAAALLSLGIGALFATH